jgi:hypothetical protein
VIGYGSCSQGPCVRSLRIFRDYPVAWSLLAADPEHRDADAEGSLARPALFSAWNGSHPDLVQAVRAALHDPRSFEHVGTVLAGQDGSAQRAVVMTYRARNPLGATVTSRASATIYPPACALSIVSLEH